mgnify:FL=1
MLRNPDSLPAHCHSGPYAHKPDNNIFSDDFYKSTRRAWAGVRITNYGKDPNDSVSQNIKMVYAQLKVDGLKSITAHHSAHDNVDIFAAELELLGRR